MASGILTPENGRRTEPLTQGVEGESRNDGTTLTSSGRGTMREGTETRGEDFCRITLNKSMP